MSFVKNIFDKMGSTEPKDELDDEDASEETSSESTDTGICGSSDLEMSGHQLAEADCSAISNFFGYW